MTTTFQIVEIVRDDEKVEVQTIWDEQIPNIKEAVNQLDKISEENPHVKNNLAIVEVTKKMIFRNKGEI